MSVRVYKIGGPALEDPALVPPLAAELRRGDGPAVLVHGGGRAIERMLKALAIESRFVDGRRVTSPEAMDVVEMVLSGLANKALAAGLTAAGVPAIGISGRDGSLVRARLEPSLGRVGLPEHVDVGADRGALEGRLPAGRLAGRGRPRGRGRERQRRRGGARHRARRSARRRSSTSPTSTACASATGRPRRSRPTRPAPASRTARSRAAWRSR